MPTVKTGNTNANSFWGGFSGGYFAEKEKQYKQKQLEEQRQYEDAIRQESNSIKAYEQSKKDLAEYVKLARERIFANPNASEQVKKATIDVINMGLSGLQQQASMVGRGSEANMFGVSALDLVQAPMTPTETTTAMSPELMRSRINAANAGVATAGLRNQLLAQKLQEAASQQEAVADRVEAIQPSSPEEPANSIFSALPEGIGTQNRLEDMVNNLFTVAPDTAQSRQKIKLFNERVSKATAGKANYAEKERKGILDLQPRVDAFVANPKTEMIRLQKSKEQAENLVSSWRESLNEGGLSKGEYSKLKLKADELELLLQEMGEPMDFYVATVPAKQIEALKQNPEAVAPEIDRVYGQGVSERILGRPVAQGAGQTGLEGASDDEILKLLGVQ